MNRSSVSRRPAGDGIHRAPSFTVYTAGHGARTLDDFIALLRGADIESVIDVRRYPGSRRHPHFGAEALTASLAEQGIGYRWLGDELGGRRRGSGGASRWRNPAFAAYAEHMATPEFARGLDEVKGAAVSQRVAVLCSETLWWRCHRRLIADALVAGGFTVEHLVRPGRPPDSHRPLTGP